MAREIQLEWIFLQHVTQYTGQVFEGLGKVLQETFLTRLLFEISETLPPSVGDIGIFPVKKDGLGQHNPVTSSEEKYTSFLRARFEMIVSVTGEWVFPTADHIQVFKEEQRHRKIYQDDKNDAKLWVIVIDQKHLRETHFPPRQSHGFLYELTEYYGN